MTVIQEHTGSPDRAGVSLAVKLPVDSVKCLNLIGWKPMQMPLQPLCVRLLSAGAF